MRFENIKKVCNFYVSKEHLALVLLPYMNYNVQMNSKIYVMSEELEEEDFNAIVKKLNIKLNDKLKNIKWINIDEIRKDNFTVDKNICIIAGGREFINKGNNIVYDCINNNEKVELIDCYNLNQIAENSNNILEEYDYYLNTSGEFQI